MQLVKIWVVKKSWSRCELFMGNKCSINNKCSCGHKPTKSYVLGGYLECFLVNI
jgi:hypothetical protein